MEEKSSEGGAGFAASSLRKPHTPPPARDLMRHGPNRPGEGDKGGGGHDREVCRSSRVARAGPLTCSRRTERPTDQSLWRPGDQIQRLAQSTIGASTTRTAIDRT
jgi:hypothetical protein